ncbi:hypothetical protein LCGC14_2063800 [marine sediment metagenome]|uniref:Phage protein n=1 Tax=marine sediment metagenome TaxID=412755 RepID=A0A0F9EK96_9ZZZZ
MKKEYYKVEGLPNLEYNILYFHSWDDAINSITDYFADTLIGDECSIKFTTVTMTEEAFMDIINTED